MRRSTYRPVADHQERLVYRLPGRFLCNESVRVRPEVQQAVRRNADQTVLQRLQDNPSGQSRRHRGALRAPTAAAWIATYDKFAPICHEISVTELEVSTGSGTPPPAAVTAQANQYDALFKLFLDRSYGSGKGKIVSVSLDGLNDKFAMRSNQASSLWDVNFQCKPAYYAVVDTADNYHALAALITETKKLSAKEFSAVAWAEITKARQAAQESLDKNYSSSDPAAVGLGNALKNLLLALQEK